MKNKNEFDLLGPKIRHFRQQKDYSQEYMARELGLTQTSYSKIEKNASEASLDRLHKIAEILEVKLEDLLSILRDQTFTCMITSMQMVQITEVSLSIITLLSYSKRSKPIWKNC